MNTFTFIKEHLAGPGRPRVLTTAMLRRLLDVAHGASARSSNAWRIKEMVGAGALGGVVKGVYLNLATTPPVEAAEALPFLRRGAVVSLHFVLGEFGVFNNHTDHITAILPVPRNSRGASFPRINTVQTGTGTFTFYGMAAEKLHAGDYEDRLIPSRFYPCATPERAFLDYLYLGANHRSSLTMPPLDSDIGDLDQTRIWRLAAAMGVEEILDSWISKKATYDEDEDVQNNMSLRLGF